MKLISNTVERIYLYWSTKYIKSNEISKRHEQKMTNEIEHFASIVNKVKLTELIEICSMPNVNGVITKI